MIRDREGVGGGIPAQRRRTTAGPSTHRFFFRGEKNNQTIKQELAMPRGGHRLGAGRKRSTGKPSFDFQLQERLRGLPVGEEGLLHRVVLALATYGALVGDIAA